MKKLEKITPWNEDFSRWFIDVIKGGELMEYGPIKGTIIFKPNSYAIWENIQKNLDAMFKEKGTQNVYLPMLIPSSFINKEKDHVAGFAPELATVTKVGNEKLHEELYIRPTSETLFGDLFKREVESYKDLPLIYNQWTSVMRWEKKTNPFLRTSEFLWQEGHTVHADPMEARTLTRSMIKIYERFAKRFLAIPTIVGKKTHKEKFAGACSTYTIEAMMKDGKALQAGTSHYLAQNFSRAFDIIFTNRDNKPEYAYQTSWGVSTRLIGALIMTHGDDRGIIIPPKIAPTHVDILELFASKNPRVSEVADEIKKSLSKKLSIKIDKTNNQPGFKAANSEIKGTPLRIEVGPRDLERNEVVIVRRDTLEKEVVKLENVKERVIFLLKEIQNNLYKTAKERMQKNIVFVRNYDEFKEAIAQSKFALAPFAGSDKEEEQIKEETGASSRCIPFKYPKPIPEAECIITGEKTKRFVIFAKAY